MPPPPSDPCVFHLLITVPYTSQKGLGRREFRQLARSPRCPRTRILTSHRSWQQLRDRLPASSPPEHRRWCSADTRAARDASDIPRPRQPRCSRPVCCWGRSSEQRCTRRLRPMRPPPRRPNWSASATHLLRLRTASPKPGSRARYPSPSAKRRSVSPWRNAPRNAWKSRSAFLLSTALCLWANCPPQPQPPPPPVTRVPVMPLHISIEQVSVCTWSTEL